jgi:sigma-E factor negative regulatory protein RseA
LVKRWKAGDAMSERISELMDGELDDRSAGSTIDAMARDGALSEAWRTYHLISDAMRDSGVLSAGFTDRVTRQLAQEPTVLAPQRASTQPPQRFALAAAASVAAVSLVGWLAFGPPRDAGAPLAQAPVAQAKSPVLVPIPTAANDYLLAHQGFSPRVSFQGMAPYVMTVSEPSDEARR